MFRIMTANIDVNSLGQRAGSNSSDYCVINTEASDLNCVSSLANSSSVLSTICEIKDRSGPYSLSRLTFKPHLHNYNIGMNDLFFPIYISVELCPDSLFMGKYLQTIQL